MTSTTVSHARGLVAIALLQLLAVTRSVNAPVSDSKEGTNSYLKALHWYLIFVLERSRRKGEHTDKEGGTVSIGQKKAASFRRAFTHVDTYV